MAGQLRQHHAPARVADKHDVIVDPVEHGCRGLDVGAQVTQAARRGTRAGQVESVDVWGKRRLAYEIDKNAEGIYAVIDLRAEPATVKELDRQLTLNESVLRTKVIRPDAR